MGFNTVETGKPDPKTIYGQRLCMGKDHIWARTIYGERPWDRETGPNDHIWDSTQLIETEKLDPMTIYGIQRSWDRETGPNDHIWDSTQLGQGNRTQ